MTTRQAHVIAAMVATLVVLSLALMLTGCKNDNPGPRPSYPKSPASVARIATTPVNPGATTTTAPQAVSDPYSSCVEVRADNADPITTTHPRWNPSLDRDHDGSACE